MSTEEEPSPTEPVSGFDGFGLDTRLLLPLKAMGFEQPTPIQAEAIPHLLAGRDIIGRARTGSGKTAAFGLPLLERVKQGGKRVRVLVLTPTRELAQQIGKALRAHATQLPKVYGVTIYGGAPYPPQIKALKQGCNIVVGTPGRVIDLLERGSLKLSALELFVLDEADEMLRMGFIEDVERLLAETPEGRQVALFSATMPDAIRKVASTYLNEPVEVQVEDKALSVGHIEQRWLVVPNRHKLDALMRILQGTKRGSTLVFARTRVSCMEVAEALSRQGYAVDALHGDLSQPARERVLNRLRGGRLNLLIATDVAARGLDVERLTHVINLDMPDNKEGYVHRIGRTGRAGRKGVAISLLTPAQRHIMGRLEQTLGVQMTRIQVPTNAQIAKLKRGALAAQLAEAPEAPFNGLHWLTELMEERGWTAEEVAARSLQLLAEQEGISLVAEQAGDDELPEWARAVRRAPSGRRPFGKKRGFPKKRGGRPTKGGKAGYGKAAGRKVDKGPKGKKGKKGKKKQQRKGS